MYARRHTTSSVSPAPILILSFLLHLCIPHDFLSCGIRPNFVFIYILVTHTALPANVITRFNYRNIKKLSRYRPGQPLRFQEAEAPEFLDNRHMKVIGLSALGTGRLYPQEVFLVLISVRGWVDSRAIVRPEWLSHWKIPMTIRNRTRDLPSCSAVSQPTAPPRTPIIVIYKLILFNECKLQFPIV
jgi:hypothetical protein